MAQFLSQRWRNQPQGSAVFDAGSPLARGHVALVLGGRTHNLVNQAQRVQVGSPTTTAPRASPFGRTWYQSENNTANRWDYPVRRSQASNLGGSWWGLIRFAATLPVSSIHYGPMGRDASSRRIGPTLSSATNYWCAYVRDNGGNQYTQASTVPAVAYQWRHVAVVADHVALELRLFLDGQRITAGAFASLNFNCSVLALSDVAGSWECAVMGLLNRPLKDAEVAELAESPYRLIVPQRKIFLPVSAGGGGYTLTAATGAFTTTGNAAALRAARRLAASPGAFTLTGFSAALRADRKLPAASASFAATFYDATLTYSGAGGAYALTAEAATFTTTGNAATLRAARKLLAASASFATTGYAATLTDGGRRISAGAATFSTTFYPATLTTTGTVEAPAPDVVPAGRPKRRKKDGIRRVIIGKTLYEVPERDLPALLESQLLNRKPPRTAQPQPAAKKAAATRVEAAQQADAALVVPDYYPSVVEAQERYTSLMREFQAQADAEVRAMLDRVASRVLAELEDEEDAASLLLMQ